MGRLVVVSNRVADPRKAAAGGLAVALGESLQQSGGLWFGWSGTVVQDGPTGEGELHKQQAGKVMLATIDLSREDHDSYYLGYSNDVLWPVFHNRLDLAHFDAGFIGGYRRVNQLFARKLMPLLAEDDIIWVHDYHMIPLAAELRAMGCKNRIGFFLHIPLPPQIIFAAIPQHDWLMRSLFAYDLIGLQANQDVRHFEHYVINEAHGEVLGNGLYSAYGHTVRAGAFPIGIDVDEFAALTHAKESRDMYETMKREYSSRRLLVGIDRLDYSKGIPQRVRAFRELLASYPENRRSATLIQIASPTRETVDAYADIRRELESMCGAINGDFGELDWMPVRYIHRIVARKLDPNRFVLAASPQYLARMGTPRTLADLEEHRALMYRGPSAVLKWQGLDEDGWRELAIEPAFISNEGASLIELACQHGGMVLLSAWGLKAQLERGELVEVKLEQPVSVSRGGDGGIYLLYLQTRYRIPKVRVAVEFLLERLGQA